MTIPQLRFAAMDLPLARPFRIARGERTVAENLLIEIEAEGEVGRGEAAPNVRYGQSRSSALEALRSFRWPAGRTPFDIEPVLESFQEHAPLETAARAGLQSALWDWTGRRMDRPLWQLLGLPSPDGLASVSSWTISIDEPERIAERVAEAAHWPVYKVKLGGGDSDVASIEALRQATRAPFRVDANESWNEAEALEKIPWLAELGCEFVEQPLPAADLDAATRVRERSPIPVVADEAVRGRESLPALTHAYDGINVKLMKCGGLSEAIRLLHAARELEMEILLGCFVESGLGIAAAAVLAPLARWLDLDGAALLALDPFEGCQVENGELRLSGQPGLGVEPRAGSAD